MTISNTLLSAGISTGQPWLIGLGVVGSLIGGSSRKSTANKLAAIESKRAGIQNKIFAEEAALTRDNLMLERRRTIRRGEQAKVGALVQEVSQTGGRSSSRAAVNRAISSQTSENVSNIDRAISTGNTITGYNQQLADLQEEAAQVQAGQSVVDQVL